MCFLSKVKQIPKQNKIGEAIINTSLIQESVCTQPKVLVYHPFATATRVKKDNQKNKNGNAHIVLILFL